MAAIDYLTLRSTLMYTSPGVLAPVGSIFTVADSRMQTMNTTVSSIGASTITVSTLQGSTIVANGITLSTLTVSTINGSLPGSGSGTALTSTMVSIGASTNQTNNFSNGSFTTGWGSTLTGATSIKTVVLSNNGAFQTILQNSGSTMSTVITSLDSGFTWAGSTTRGLPISGALPYQTYGSTINTMTVPSITAITAAPSSGNQLAIASNELVYSSANSGATFAPTGLGQNNNPFIYIPFDGSVTDVMGNSAVTATATSGSISYVPGKVGTNAVNLNNSAAVGGVPSQYLRGTWTGASNFTFSGWFNAQTINGTQQMIYSAYQAAFMLFITTSNQLIAYTPSGGAASAIIIGVTSFTISANTWYSFTIVYQAGGICSFYVNNALIGTIANVGGIGTLTSTQFSLGTYDSALANAFNGYICDFRIYNYAVTNPSGAALINPLVGPIIPFVYLTFDGSTTTDVMGNSTTTATGTMAYVAGQVGSNAVSLLNTAGSNADRYIRGTWSGAANFTVSFWFNAQSLGQIQVLSSAYSNSFVIYLNASNTIGMNIPSAGGVQVTATTSYTITSNTWYYVTSIFQTNGACSLYVNNSLVGTSTNSGGVSPYTTVGFSIGTYDVSSTIYAFRGYIDDFRIYNGAFTPSQLSPVLYSPSHAVGSPNIYLPFENGSVLDVMGYSAIAAIGTMNFVPGVVGTSALNLVNPAGGTAVNYLRGSWAGSPNFTVSFWFNAQALGAQQILFSTYTGNYVIYLNPSNQIVIYLPSGGAPLNALTGPVISINTWYYVTANFQTNGTCTLYLNNSLIGSYTNSGGVSPYTTAAFGIGTYDHTTIQAFNGYIDDLKIYNSAVPFSALGPMNYTQAALSNSGAYQVVAAANGGVYTSANSGSSWTQATTSPQVASAVNTVGGQVITPNLTGLAAATWAQNGVSWVASSSSVLGSGYEAYRAFNQVTTDNWNGASSYTPSGIYLGSATTTIQTIGTVSGDWIQLQSSAPLVLQSYTYGCGGQYNIFKKYYIAGSNNGITWYPVHYMILTTNPCNATNNVCTTYLLVNYTGTQTIQGGVLGSGTSTSYSTSTTPYTYFRFIQNESWVAGGNTGFQIAELYLNFTTPPTPLYVAPSTALIANQSLNAINVMPQQTGLTGGATTTWTTHGISWTASSSSAYASTYYAYMAFNNYGGGGDGWVTNTTNYTTTPLSSGTSTTVLGGIGTVYGEWIQIQSSVPLIMSTYQLGFGGTPLSQLPRTFYIVGSVDGTNWYPLQSAVGAAIPGLNPFVLVPSATIVNSTSTQIWGTSTIATTAYSTSTSVYTYFRLIVTSTFTTSTPAYAIIGEWAINFTAYTPSAVQALAVSPTGQYMALTGAGATAPNVTGLASSSSTITWTTNGVTWIGSASSSLNSTVYAFSNVFNNTPNTSWASSSNTYNTSGNSSGIITTVQGVGSLTGEWVQLQSSVPLVMTSYQFATGGFVPQFVRTYYIVGSNDGTTWFRIQYGEASTTVPTSTTFTTIPGFITVNNTSTQPFGLSTLSTTAYSTTTNAYTYFRIICLTNYYTVAPVYVEIGEWYINFQSGPTYYSTNYGSNWTQALSTATVPNANVLATSGNGQYSLQASGQTVTLVTNTFAGYGSGTYTTPTFNPVLAAGRVIAAALSLTGQYMVVLIQSTTNNVYYSTNYGVSFTGLTVGSSPMVSCAMSADGSYITVANVTQAYTLNRNIQGYSIAVGNQAGQMNQAQNAIAIGNQAGQTNQSANSIILNASGAAVNSFFPGFYVAPIANYAFSSAASFSILGYGSDSQVVQTGLTLLANGNVGIGTTNPGYALHVIGAIYASGNITALSDQRYKQNIVRLDRSLDMICSLSGYFYTRTDYQPGIRQIGLLAQEVNKVIPEAVSYDSSNDTYSLNYGCLIAPVIEAVKEINEKVDSRIRELEAKIGAQQVLIQTLMDRAL